MRPQLTAVGSSTRFRHTWMMSYSIFCEPKVPGSSGSPPGNAGMPGVVSVLTRLPFVLSSCRIDGEASCNTAGIVSRSLITSGTKVVLAPIWAGAWVEHATNRLAPAIPTPPTKKFPQPDGIEVKALLFDGL